MHDEVPLAGGNMSAVVRSGDHVHRSTGAWTPTVHRLLHHLASRGITWTPRPAGIDERGRERLDYLVGTVPHDPMPQWVWADRVLVRAAQRMAELHEATVGYRDDAAIWQLPVHEPGEVICHNDFAPYNMVFDATHDLVGVIDWDTVSPGPRVWDLAYLAYRLVPLSAPGNPDSLDLPIEDRRRRLAMLCEAYDRTIAPALVAEAAIHRLRELAEFTARRAAAGRPDVVPHVRLYTSAARWIEGSAHLLG